jgi:beta-lactam-binding protein with PASTA domain
MMQDAATAALSAAGFTVTVVTVDTDDATKDGVVLSTAPTGWQEPGTPITITVARFVDSGGGGGGGGGGNG